MIRQVGIDGHSLSLHYFFCFSLHSCHFLSFSTHLASFRSDRANIFGHHSRPHIQPLAFTCNIDFQPFRCNGRREKRVLEIFVHGDFEPVSIGGSVRVLGFRRLIGPLSIRHFIFDFLFGMKPTSELLRSKFGNGRRMWAFFDYSHNTPKRVSIHILRSNVCFITSAQFVGILCHQGNFVLYTTHIFFT